MSTKLFRFILQTPSGALPEMAVRIPEGPMKLSGLVPFMHALADAIIESAIAQAAQRNEKVTCGPHCGACCCQLIPVSGPEVFFIVERLLATPLDERAPLLKRFETIERRLAHSDLDRAIRSLGDSGADNNEVAKRYFGLGESCPFLKEQSCSIHGWRPVVCREFNATSEPSLCVNPFAHRIRTVPLVKRPSSALAIVASRLTNLAPALVPLPLVFDWFEQNRDLSIRTWPGTELFELLMSVIAEQKGGEKAG